MSSYVRYTASDVSLASRDASSITVGEYGIGGAYGAASQYAAVPSAIQPLQLGWDPHLAAAASLFVLVLLGGVLVVRNRLTESESIASESEPRGEEYLTDKERVRQLISQNGGRMKQSKIVESVDWSKAKVSRLLAQLEEDGQITKLRLGRENLVCLSGHEPSASKSPEQPKHD